MAGRTTRLDAARFGPWALITGASSGIGRGFAEQIAANKVNVVLVARRLPALDELGRELAARHGIRFQSLRADLAGPDSAAKAYVRTLGEGLHHELAPRGSASPLSPQRDQDADAQPVRR